MSLDQIYRMLSAFAAASDPEYQDTLARAIRVCRLAAKPLHRIELGIMLNRHWIREAVEEARRG